MSTDFQDGLSSVAEVAIFAWSLLELLFTRIFPLVGFLTGHLLLQFASLFSSVVITAASQNRSERRRLRASTDYSYVWEELQAVQEEVIEEGDDVHAVKDNEQIWGVPQAKEVAHEVEAKKEDQIKVPVAVTREEEDDEKSSAESLKSSDEEHGEISRRESEEKAPILVPSIAKNERAEADATAGKAALPPSTPPEEQVTASNDSGNEKLGRNDTHVAQSSPSNVQKVNDLPPLEKYGDDANKLPAESVAKGHVSSKAEGSAGKIIDAVKQSETGASEEATRAASRSGEMRKMSGEGGAEMRKSKSSRGVRSILRVLPPSLSQVERNLRQRSRRVSFSQA